MYTYIYILKLDFQINNYVRTFKRTFYNEKNIFKFSFFSLVLITRINCPYIYTHIYRFIERKTNDTKIFNFLSSWTKEELYAQRNLHYVKSIYDINDSRSIFHVSMEEIWLVCVYVYVLNWELGSISASVGNETRGVTMWKRNERNRTKQKTGRGRGKKKKMKGKKKR